MQIKRLDHHNYVQLTWLQPITFKYTSITFYLKFSGSSRIISFGQQLDLLKFRRIRGHNLQPADIYVSRFAIKRCESKPKDLSDSHGSQ
jgi:hypothetical protein